VKYSVGVAEFITVFALNSAVLPAVRDQFGKTRFCELPAAADEHAIGVTRLVGKSPQRS